MKKELTKIWGVGLTIVLATSLLLAAVPVAAGTLSWGTFSPMPSTTGQVLSANVNVADLAVADDGVIWVVTGTDNRSYKSTNGGVSWSRPSKEFLFNPDFIAVAPDDSDVVAVATSTGNVTISTNGGSTWGALGNVTGILTMYDLALSNTDGSVNYLGVAGNTTGNAADVWYWKIGDTAPNWKSTRALGSFAANQDAAFAVEFSPNVASDKVMVTVTANSSATGNVSFQMYSLSTDAWNTPFGTDYPAEIDGDTGGIQGLDGAAIALAPDYLGSDDAMRVAFVGLNTGTAEAGIYRLKDTSDKDIYDADGYNIYSIAYDGTNLVAGNALNAKVYRCDDPLASSPTFSGTSELKRPGTVISSTDNNKIIVAWKGADVVAGTSGQGSAFAISKDNGASFNDISLIDITGTNLGAIDDVAVSADGETIYILTRDAKTLSLFRRASSWERVFSIAPATDYIVRIAPDDPDAVYLARRTVQTLYFSQEGGSTKWFTRTSKYLIQDLAVESADNAYVARYGSVTVSKTTNSGFTWGTEEPTGVSGDSIHMIRSLGEDKVIVGSNTGYVAWSSDGNDSWSKVNTQLTDGLLTQVTASGLADGDFIYAATSFNGTRVERWEIGQSGSSWKNLEAPTTDLLAYGIALVEGVLYVQTAGAADSTTLRTLNPSTAEPAAGNWSTDTEADVLLTASPQALKTSAGSTKLWAVSGAALYYYEDTLGATGPTLSSPRDGLAVEINPVSGVAYDVALTWNRPSKAKVYDVRVALDSGFVEVVYSTNTSSITDATISEVVAGSSFMPETTYYWRIRVAGNGPVKSPYSVTRSFTIGSLPEPVEPVIIQQPPAPVISVPPAPSITIEPPQIVLPPPPPAPPEIVIPPAPAPPAPITPAFIWAIIIIGAILVIAVVVLIVRTRRPV